MGLFKSSSKSSSTTTNSTEQLSATIGDLSRVDEIIGGDKYTDGLDSEDAKAILDNQNAFSERIVEFVGGVFDKTVNALSDTTSQAIKTTENAYNTQDGFDRLMINLKQFAPYATIGAIFYFLTRFK